MIFYKNAFANNTRKGYTCDANRLSRDAIRLRQLKRRYVTYKPLRSHLLILHVRTVIELSTRVRVLQETQDKRNQHVVSGYRAFDPGEGTASPGSAGGIRRSCCYREFDPSEGTASDLSHYAFRFSCCVTGNSTR